MTTTATSDGKARRATGWSIAVRQQGHRDIADVHKTPLRVIRVESDVYQTIADINAELLQA